MAFTPSIVEHSICQFMHQWSIGLTPSLCITTHSDGSVTFSSKIRSFPPPRYATESVSPKLRKKRSGQPSRHRRKINRSGKAQIPEPVNVGNTVTTSTEQDTSYEIAASIDLAPITDCTSQVDDDEKLDILEESNAATSSSQPPQNTTVHNTCEPSDQDLVVDDFQDIIQSATVEVKYCGFCDQECSNGDAFKKHLERYGFICNNCLDYFSDCAWFPEVESGLAYVRTGAITAFAAS